MNVSLLVTKKSIVKPSKKTEKEKFRLEPVYLQTSR